MQAISEEHEAVNSLLILLDIFSKFAWGIPVKNKGGNEKLNAFNSLFEKSSPRIPEKLQTDPGRVPKQRASSIFDFQRSKAF